jgi:hypothetical protein
MLGEAVIRLLDPPQVRRPSQQNDAAPGHQFWVRDLDLVVAQRGAWRQSLRRRGSDRAKCQPIPARNSRRTAARG